MLHPGSGQRQDKDSRVANSFLVALNRLVDRDQLRRGLQECYGREEESPLQASNAADAGMLLAKLGLEPTNAFVFIKDRSPTAGHPK